MKNTEYSPVKNHLAFLLILISSIICFLAVVKVDIFSVKNKPSDKENTSVSPKEPRLDTFISYQLSAGWKKEERNPKNETDDDSLSFVSSDYERNIAGGINTGANIRVYRQLKDPRKTTLEIIKQTLPVSLKMKQIKLNL